MTIVIFPREIPSASSRSSSGRRAVLPAVGDGPRDVGDGHRGGQFPPPVPFSSDDLRKRRATDPGCDKDFSGRPAGSEMSGISFMPRVTQFGGTRTIKPVPAIIDPGSLCSPLYRSAARFYGCRLHVGLRINKIALMGTDLKSVPIALWETRPESTRKGRNLSSPNCRHGRPLRLDCSGSRVLSD